MGKSRPRLITTSHEQVVYTSSSSISYLNTKFMDKHSSQQLRAKRTSVSPYIATFKKNLNHGSHRDLLSITIILP
jgi:hypothetical protein